MRVRVCVFVCDQKEPKDNMWASHERVRPFDLCIRPRTVALTSLQISLFLFLPCLHSCRVGARIAFRSLTLLCGRRPAHATCVPQLACYQGQWMLDCTDTTDCVGWLETAIGSCHLLVQSHWHACPSVAVGVIGSVVVVFHCGSITRVIRNAMADAWGLTFGQSIASVGTSECIVGQ